MGENKKYSMTDFIQTSKNCQEAAGNCRKCKSKKCCAWKDLAKIEDSGEALTKFVLDEVVPVMTVQQHLSAQLVSLRKAAANLSDALDADGTWWDSAERVQLNSVLAIPGPVLEVVATPAGECSCKPKKDGMTREEALNAMRQGHKVTHRNFSAEEYIHIVDIKMLTEDGCDYSDVFFSNIDWQEDGWSIVV